jgi:hypothetical protein
VYDVPRDRVELVCVELVPYMTAESRMSVGGKNEVEVDWLTSRPCAAYTRLILGHKVLASLQG